MSRNDDRPLGHGDQYDGIDEYDNPMPDWWVGMFFLTILWSVGYATNFHFLSRNSQEKWYEEELAAARREWPELQRAAGLDNSPATLAAGAEVFATNCASCHNVALTGGIGPNLIDDRWIHGADFAAVSKTINEGVGAKGMPAWGPILGPQKAAAVASYLLSKNEGEAARSKTTAMGAYAEPK